MCTPINVRLVAVGTVVYIGLHFLIGTWYLVGLVLQSGLTRLKWACLSCKDAMNLMQRSLVLSSMELLDLICQSGYSLGELTSTVSGLLHLISVLDWPLTLLRLDPEFATRQSPVLDARIFKDVTFPRTMLRGKGSLSQLQHYLTN